jgi:NitT/TauT family transport system substrate-binding protein
MHEQDLNNRPEWSQKVVNAIVKAQVWTRDNRAEAAKLLSKDGANATRRTRNRCSTGAGAGRQRPRAVSGQRRDSAQHWDEQRIDFQPYPFPSYTEELVKRLKDTLIEGDKGFLASLDPQQTARTWSTIASCATPSLQSAA